MVVGDWPGVQAEKGWKETVGQGGVCAPGVGASHGSGVGGSYVSPACSEPKEVTRGESLGRGLSVLTLKRDLLNLSA